jgi:glycosyltransferase involved in cell wall biosynthesis
MINLIAPINNLGYGVAGYNLFKHLYQVYPSVALYPISKPAFIDEYVQSGLDNRMSTGINCVWPSVKIWHQNDLHTHVGHGKHIGFPIFELTEFNHEEKISISHCDRLFVCSQWAKDIVLDQTSFPESGVHVVPLGVDTELFTPHVSQRPQTVFFNCGKWEIRKGHDILLECFNAAFNSSDNVELWMMCENPFIGQANQDWINRYKQSPLGGKIRIIPRQDTHKDVYNIMRQTDCGIFPARAEGWNLELLEMMACGKTVIATNYSAHTEFCDSDNTMLIEPDGLERAKDGVFFSGDYGEWASLGENSKEQLINHMRTFHNDKQTKHELNDAGVNTANKYTWQNSTKELLNGLPL